eukprot:m.110206 g.110206  ORF g.110206 m.110206 type:complete len:314 (+) comp22709_c0_seq1:29-970(+)
MHFTVEGWVALIAALVLGLLKTLFGHRLFRGGIFWNGFLIFSVLLYCLLWGLTNFHEKACLYVAIAVGVLTGILATIFWRYCTFTYGVIFGAFLANIFLSSPYSMEHWHTLYKDLNMYAIYGTCMVAFMIIAQAQPKPSIIISTAAGGALSIVLAIDHMITPTGFSRRFFVMFAKATYTSSIFGFDIHPVPANGNNHEYFMLGGWALIWLIGVLLQWLVVSRHFNPHKRTRALFSTASAQWDDPLTPLLVNSQDWTPSPSASAHTPRRSQPRPSHRQNRDSYGTPSSSSQNNFYHHPSNSSWSANPPEYSEKQ